MTTEFSHRDGVMTTLIAAHGGGRPVSAQGRVSRRSGFEEVAAAHEAGHCVSAHHLGLAFFRVTVDPVIAGPGNAGCVFFEPGNYWCKPLDVDLGPPPIIDGKPLSAATRTYLFAKTVMLFAGNCSEQLLLSDRSQRVGSISDDAKANFYAGLFADPTGFIKEARAWAVSILTTNRRQVEAVAAALVDQQTLSRAAIDDLLSEYVTPAQRAERARRRRWSATTASAVNSGLVLLEGAR